MLWVAPVAPVCSRCVWSWVARWGSEFRLELGCQGLKLNQAPVRSSQLQPHRLTRQRLGEVPDEAFEHRKGVLPRQLHGALGRSFSGGYVS